MGQYLSAPATEKDSEEGHVETLAYGLAAMQGWRVSMEDAHIAQLDLDPATHTSLFSVFDGHGGRAVSQFCAAHLAEEFVKSEQYRRGDLAGALTHAYYRLDVLLESEAGNEELRRYVAEAKPKDPGQLFSDVESKLSGEGHGSFLDDPGAPQSRRSAAPAAAAAPAPSSSGANEAADSDRAALEAQGQRALKKLDSSKDFLESHLMRASVLTPLERIQPSDESSSQGGDGGGSAAAAKPPRLATVHSGLEQGASGGEQPAGGATTANGSASEEEEEEENHAAGMGATAASVVVRGNKVIVANTGDSRCVLSKRGQARALTLDHKPILFEEAKRIIRAGGFVRDNRINGALNVSRTIGDMDFKRNQQLPHTEQMVVATPDIEVVSLEEGDEFLVLACDGIWDVLTNQEAVDFVRKRIKSGESLRSICEQMCDACLAPDLKGLCRGADNMSVIVILFKKHAKLSGFWGGFLKKMGLPGARTSKSFDAPRR